MTERLAMRAHSPWTRRRSAQLGHRLVDQLAEFLESVPHRPGDARRIAVRGAAALDLDGPLPEHGTDAGGAARTDRARCCSSTRSSTGIRDSSATSPRRRRRSASSATFSRPPSTPTSARGRSSPAATEIEAQTVRWIAELIGYPTECGGLLVSGGNMANFVCFCAARAAKAAWNVREHGVADDPARGCASTAPPKRTRGFRRPPISRASAPTSIRWIPTDADLRMDVEALRARDRRRIARPATCRSWSSARPARSAPARSTRCATIAAVCREHGAWFHVDGAYGGFAAASPEAPADLRGLSEADSVAVDPHKWLYAPLEAGCALVRDPRAPARGVRVSPALLPLRRAGDELRRLRAAELARLPRAQGLAGAAARRRAPATASMIAEDIRLSRALADAVRRTPELRVPHAGAEHHDVPLRAGRSASAARRAGGRTTPRRAQPRTARPPAARRRGVRVERGRRRPLRAARLHRELPHDPGGR